MIFISYRDLAASAFLYVVPQDFSVVCICLVLEPFCYSLTFQRMTKLMEWVTVAVLGLTLWLSAYSGVAMFHQIRTEILWSPVALVLILGVYSVLTIAYR